MGFGCTKSNKFWFKLIFQSSITLLKTKIMKQIVLLFIVMLLPITAVSQTEINGIYYNLDKNLKTAVVTYISYSETYEGSVTIPSKVRNGGVEYIVTEIGKNAFSRCSRLTSVTIPDGVEDIGSYAFSECYNLETVNIPNSVRNIGMGAFQDCRKLKSIILPNINRIMERTFQGCKSMTSITIPQDVKLIGYMAFYDFGNNATITILSDYTNIEANAFYACSVKTIFVPKGTINYYKRMSGFAPNCKERFKEK